MPNHLLQFEIKIKQTAVIRSEKSDRLQIEKKETLVIQRGKTLKKAQKVNSSKETKRKQMTKNLQDMCSPKKENVATTKKSKKQK